MADGPPTSGAAGELIATNEELMSKNPT